MRNQRETRTIEKGDDLLEKRRKRGGEIVVIFQVVSGGVVDSHAAGAGVISQCETLFVYSRGLTTSPERYLTSKGDNNLLSWVKSTYTSQHRN
ncbi:hypothetical protein GOBAR_AA21578 [Gossypium barbadense]|uniref:Uncharacterized protein n=1 Tax=Gossypium barbadense TaxID=3634 RepID=A0A2P5X6X5_GOSBA|nr:hypothetical protein GOBAR_AA21578 [Gossypium barbadense]